MKLPPVGFFVSIDYSGEDNNASSQHGPDLSCSNGNFRIGITLFPRPQVFHHQTAGVLLVLSGWIRGFASCEQLAEMYLAKGRSFANDLDGSFTLLVIDLPGQKVLAITDRVGSRSIFTRNCHGQTLISTSVTALAGHDFKISQTGLAWYLANGVVHKLGSIFEGIRRLERASVYEFTDTGEKQHVYWRYILDDSYAGRSGDDLKTEMEGLLVESVRNSLPAKRPIIFSLSKGYDVSGILGIMVERLGVADIETFSYGLDHANPQFDSYLARELAENYHLPNTFIPSYRGNLCDVLENNADQFGGVAEFCDEINAWETLEGEYGGKSLPVYTGELAFGWTKAEINSISDVLNLCLVRSFDNLKWLKYILPSGLFHGLRTSLEEDTLQLVDKYKDEPDLHRIRDLMFMDVVKPNTLLPWREYYAGRIFEYHAPYQSRELLEFTMRLPEEWRTGKRLYRETITGMFPNIFSKLAVHDGVMPNWESEFRTHKNAVAKQFILNGTHTELDGYISPEVLMRLLDMQANPDAYRFTPIQVLEDLSARAANRIFNRIPVYHKQVLSSRLLLRCLVLRRYLEKIREEKPLI
jgi:hypothetical protein